MNLAAVNTMHPERNKFVADMKIKATGDLKLYDSPACKGTCTCNKAIIESTKFFIGRNNSWLELHVH